MKMELIQADFNIVTPMFLGEADGQCASQIRPPAIKGALRFWWRAINWAPIRQRYTNDNEALVELHRQEGQMFGVSAKTGPDGQAQAGGQGCFLLRVHKQNVKIIGKEKNFAKSPQLQYLLGMGLCHFKTGLLRDYLSDGGSFVVELALKPGIKLEQREQVLNTLKCFGLLGCLGSRARKGFGSASMTALSVSKNGREESLALPQNKAEYKAELQALLGDCFKAELPNTHDAPLTAITASSRMQIADSGRDALNLLADHGWEMGMYRGYGNSGKTFGRDAEQKFQFDHDWAYDVAKGSRQNDLPKRAVFGLPHPYFLSGIGKNVTIDVVGLDNKTARRASPLFAHVHRLPDGNCLLVQSLFKGLFLPDRFQVKVNAKGGGRFDLTGKAVTKGVDWKVIETFMERFTNRDMIHG